MQRTIWALFISFWLTLTVSAQFSPTPVINNEVRDNTSVRMREFALEQAKRAAKKTSVKELNETASAIFLQIKEDFENIQKLQAEIIKAYTTGKQINYLKINQSAWDIHHKSLRLRTNLFGSKKEIEETGDKQEKRAVKELIIEQDKALDDFINSPLFKNNKMVEQKDAEKTQISLEKLSNLSRRLSQVAKQQIQ